MRILVVDDHEVIRKRLQIILTQREDIQTIAEAANRGEAIEKARELSPHVIIMDISMLYRSPDGHSPLNRGLKKKRNQWRNLCRYGRNRKAVADRNLKVVALRTAIQDFSSRRFRETPP